MSLKNGVCAISHRHCPAYEAFFHPTGIQRLTKEAVCVIYGSALKGPRNKRLSVSCSVPVAAL